MTTEPINARYYHGEAEFPYEKFRDVQYAYVFWNAEHMYINQIDSSDSIRFAENCGLVEASLQIPVALLAFMFEMYCHYSDGAPEDNAIYFRNHVLPAYISDGTKENLRGR